MSTLELLQLQNEHKESTFFEKGEDFLVSELNKIAERQSLGDCDYEYHHAKADELLLDYINNEKVTEAFNKIEKWYS